MYICWCFWVIRATLGPSKAWKKEWQASTRHKRFLAKDLSTPSSKKYFELISDHGTALEKNGKPNLQLRTGHVPLNGSFTGS